MGFYHCLQPVPLVYFEYFVVSTSGFQGRSALLPGSGDGIILAGVQL
jgi:hypothetical protein